MNGRAGLDVFPLAAAYAPGEFPNPHLVREPGPGGRVFGYTERHLQAVWFDPRWRPATLTSSRGELIEVESPGNWNLEAGPDFLGAALRVGPDRRRITGDIEAHIFPAGWRQHQHREDRRYRHVCLHLTYYEGHLPDEEFPPGALQAALRPALKTDPTFAFEHIDVTAYPYAGRADIPPCRQVMSAWPVEDRARILESAGHERLRRKSDRFATALTERGPDQVFYEQIMVALGYQHNKLPFLELAGRLPVETLRELAGGDARRAFALMAGMSGLLPSDVNKEWDEATRDQVRAWWDVWWKERSKLSSPMDRQAWHMQGIRPLNHPLRRLAAAAALFAQARDGLAWLDTWLEGSAAEMVKRIQQSVDRGADPYWMHRIAMGGPVAAGPVALLGEDRAQAIALNVVIPLAAACGHDPAKIQQALAALKPEASNQVIKQTAFYLLGPDYPASLLRSANRRQGVQQIFHDYCLGDRSRCARCPFPAHLKGLHSV